MIFSSGKAGVIPVDESFITRYLPAAPGDYVKAYIYGLKCLYLNEDVDFECFCRRLGMSADSVVGAFEYWQDQGIMRIVNGADVKFEYLPADGAPSLYSHAEFNRSALKLFAPRELTPYEFERIYDYTDIFGLPQEVVLLLLEYCVKLKGKSVPINYIDAVARSWAEQDINTLERADEAVSGQERTAHPASTVLKRLGISRRPTDDEIALYAKWTDEWGFSLNAILSACPETTKARTPTMRYLDGILTNLHARGKATTQEVVSELSSAADMHSRLRDVLRELGAESLAASPAHVELYKKWLDMGFDGNMILLAANKASRHSNNMAYLDGVLKSWSEKGVFTQEELKKRQSAESALTKRVKAAFDAAGIKKQLTRQDRERFETWSNEYGMSDDMILLACEISSLAKNPYQYLDKLIRNWHERGISTLAEARSFATSSSQSADPGFEQREYPEGNIAQLNTLIFGEGRK